MARFTLTIDGDSVDATASFVLPTEDALRILAHGARRFGTQDPNVIVSRFAENAMGNLISETRMDEENIAAAAARAAVAPIVATPET
jgi:hypothetical protein